MEGEDYVSTSASFTLGAIPDPVVPEAEGDWEYVGHQLIEVPSEYVLIWFWRRSPGRRRSWLG